MQVTLTLPDTLVSRLMDQAKAINLTFNEFLLNTVQNILPIAEKSPNFSKDETVVDVVRRIQSRPPNLANIHPPTKTADEILADIEMNPPEERDYTPAEWDQMWAEFEYNLDRANHLTNISIK